MNGTEEDIKQQCERLNKLRKEKKSKKHDKNPTKSEAPAPEQKPSKNKKHALDDQKPNGSNKKVKAAESADGQDKFKEMETYKKLFHKNCEKKEGAHWVTYNPYYN